MYATVIAHVVCEAQGTAVTISFLLHFEDVAFWRSEPSTFWSKHMHPPSSCYTFTHSSQKSQLWAKAKSLGMIPHYTLPIYKSLLATSLLDEVYAPNSARIFFHITSVVPGVDLLLQNCFWIFLGQANLVRKAYPNFKQLPCN